MALGDSQWYAVDGRPEWLSAVGAACAGISDVLAWVHGEYDAWNRAHPVPPNAHPRVRSPLDRRWLCDAPLAFVRQRLMALGFQVEGDAPLPEAPDLVALRERMDVPDLDPRPWRLVRPFAPAIPRAPGVQDGYPVQVVDAWHPSGEIAVAIEWEPEPLGPFAEQVAGWLMIDAQYVVLARQYSSRDGTRSYDIANRVIAGVFSDDDAMRNLHRKLCVRGVLIVAI